MNIDHLREFSFLADSLNFSSTAHHFFLSQSVLSKHIAAMEEELHTKLFERNSHRVTLTEQGRAFKKDVDSIISRYDAALFHLQALEEGFTANIDICYLRGASRPFLHKFLLELKQHAPEIHVNLHCCEFWELQHALETHTSDIAFGMDFYPELQSEYHVEEMYTDRFDVVTNFDNAINSEIIDGKISVKALANRHLLLPDKQAYGNMEAFVRKIITADCPLNSVDYYQDIDTAMLRLLSGDRVGLSSTHNMAFYSDLIHFIPLADVDTSYKVCAFVAKDEGRSEIATCIEVIHSIQRQLRKTHNIPGGASLK